MPLVSGLSPARRRLRALRRHLYLRRRVLAALLVGAAVLVGLRVLEPAPPPTVSVLVAARDLPAGVALDADDVAARDFPADVVPAGLAVRPVGRVLAGALNEGEPVTDVRLVGPALARARPGEQAVPVRLPDAGMAALLRPGDVVDLVSTDPGTGQSRLVASSVTVLALPRTSDEGVGEAGQGALVVLGLAPEQVHEVTGASLAEFLTVTFSR